MEQQTGQEALYPTPWGANPYHGSELLQALLDKQSASFGLLRGWDRRKAGTQRCYHHRQVSCYTHTSK